jgi:phosphoadenosine phosphosulfate reductase
MHTSFIFTDEIRELDAAGLVAWAVRKFGTERVAVSSSFSAEDQIITDMALKLDAKSRIFTLDTGRHFQETYEVWQESINHWGIVYETGFPDCAAVSQLLRRGGPELFRSDVESRKACCRVRKTEPLQRILSTVDAWITGLRGGQAVTRSDLLPVEWDNAHGIYRISPLFDWSEEDVFSEAKKRGLPLSALYAKGFRSIGCAPCTRAVGPRDDVRTGRWWWEEPEHKECGLHNRPAMKSILK